MPISGMLEKHLEQLRYQHTKMSIFRKEVIRPAPKHLFHCPLHHHSVDTTQFHKEQTGKPFNQQVLTHSKYISNTVCIPKQRYTN